MARPKLRRTKGDIEVARGNKIRETNVAVTDLLVADPLASESLSIAHNAAVGGDLAVTGLATVGGTLVATGKATAAGLIISGSKGEFMGVIAAAAVPVLTAKQWCIWIDTADSTTKIAVHNGTEVVLSAAFAAAV